MGHLRKILRLSPQTVSLLLVLIVFSSVAVVNYINHTNNTNGEYSDSYSINYELNNLRKIPINSIKNSIKNSNLHTYEHIYIETYDDVVLKSNYDWQWHFTERRSDNFHLHSLDMLNPLLYKYDRSKDEQILDKSINIVIDWIKSNPASLINNQDKNFAWYDMAVGIRLYRMAYIFDQAVRSNSVEDSKLIMIYNSLIDHLAYLKINSNIIFHNNHGLYQAAGQKAAARRLKPIDVNVFGSVEQQADSRLAKMLHQQFTDEGVHKEHSPDYQRMVYGTFLTLAQDGLIESDNQKLLDSIGDSLYWMIKPNDRLVVFGDSEGRKVSKGKPLGLTDSRALKYYLTNGKQGLRPIDNFALYRESGFFAVKTNKSYLAQQAAFFSRTHKHADDLTISWYDKGRDILIDAGKYGYEGRTKSSSEAFRQGFWYSNPERQYIEKTRAHNTVEIDGRDFLRKDREPFGSALIDGGEQSGVYYALSEVNEFETINYQRLLLFKPGEWLVVIDNLDDSNDKTHNYKQWFHLAGDLSSTKVGNEFNIQVDGSALSVYQLADGKSVGPINGQTNPYLQGWYSPETYKLLPNDAIAYEATGSDVEFATVFSFKELSHIKYKGSLSKSDDSAKLTLGSDYDTEVIELTRGNTEMNIKVIK